MKYLIIATAMLAALFAGPPAFALSLTWDQPLAGDHVDEYEIQYGGDVIATVPFQDVAPIPKPDGAGGTLPIAPEDRMRWTIPPELEKGNDFVLVAVVAGMRSEPSDPCRYGPPRKPQGLKISVTGSLEVSVEPIPAPSP